MKLPSSLERMDVSEMGPRLGNDEDLIADLVGLFLEDYRAQLAKAAQANPTAGFLRNV